MAWDTALYTAKEMYRSLTLYNQILIDSATLYREDVSGNEVRVHKKDITQAVKDHFQKHQVLDVPITESKIEIRYSLNRNKYRMFSSARLQRPYTFGIPKRTIKAIDIENGDDYSDRFAKYAGPWVDFHGHKFVKLCDIFPSWSEDDLPSQVKVQIFEGKDLIDEQDVTEIRPYVTKSQFM